MCDKTFLDPDRPDLEDLRAWWKDLLVPYKVEPSAEENYFRLLAEAYTGKGRVYHTLRHIESMLRVIESVEDEIQNPDAVRFATWFHDAVYDTTRSDNEEKSAELAGRVLDDLGVPAAVSGAAQALILATKKHEAAGASPDLEIFLDADLSILGAPEEVYQEYSRAIREEYGWVPDRVYRRERRRILSGFLARPRIYFNRTMAGRYEAQARANLAREIEQL
jgi:predicted metal-dependent HD superfamily phosphohydrolase